MNGGQSIASVLRYHGVKFLFTLCGGHISPILKGAKDVGIRVIDVRHEATAVFAADAVARLSGIPGVAAVTAGPGATNTITAVKNAQLAQSPVVLLGGAAATTLKGRGALQDIDQMALFKPHVKWAQAVTRVRDLAPTLQRAFQIARSGVPGPVFVECPVDLLYDESVIREWYAASSPKGTGLADRVVGAYLQHRVRRLFTCVEDAVD
jgi:thiamine pyrophosphate-dependent acetolactate synthase large subunit-like protein